MNKRLKIIGLSVVVLLVIIAIFFIYVEPNGQDYPFIVGSGRLREISESTDASGHAIRIMEDDEYRYHYNVTRQQIQLISMKPELSETIAAVAPWGKLDRQDVDLEPYLEMFFPGKAMEALEIEFSAGGSPLEAYRYWVREWEGDILLNTATFSFTGDGRLSFAFRNNAVMPEGVEQNVDEAQAIKIAAEHLGIGEEFKEISLEKVVYMDTVAWHVECSVEMGELDSYYALYIDIESGDVMDELSTASAE